MLTARKMNGSEPSYFCFFGRPGGNAASIPNRTSAGRMVLAMRCFARFGLPGILRSAA
jgi:hypothetical protein